MIKLAVIGKCSNLDCLPSKEIGDRLNSINLSERDSNKEMTPEIQKSNNTEKPQHQSNKVKTTLNKCKQKELQQLLAPFGELDNTEEGKQIFIEVGDSSQITPSIATKKKNIEEKRFSRKQSELIQMLSPLEDLNSTEEVSGLSTIIEESNDLISRTDVESVDHTVNKSDLSSTSSSPFQQIDFNRKKQKIIELDSVKDLLTKVKRQGDILEKSDTHFVTVEDAKGRLNDKSPCTSKPYKLDQSFVKKVLEFSSSSFSPTQLSPPSSRKNKDNLKRKKKRRKSDIISPPSFTNSSCSTQFNEICDDREPTISEKPTNSNPSQSNLRYYIEKLLTLRHEDITNLSASSSSTNVSNAIIYTDKPEQSPLLGNSTNLQSIYCSSRSQILQKLSDIQADKIEAQKPDWSTFDLSSEGGTFVNSSGTISNIQLSVTEYETL